MTKDPGHFRHRIQLVSSTLTPDGLGGGTRSQTVVATVWARVEPTSSAEHTIAGGIREQNWWRITIRYPDSFSVTGDMYVVWNGRTFYIRGIMQPEAMTRWLVLTCLEGE